MNNDYDKNTDKNRTNKNEKYAWKDQVIIFIENLYLLSFRFYGRGDRIRTCDFLVPNQALCQTEPHLDAWGG